MRHKAYFSGLPTSQELAAHQLGLYTKPAVAGAIVVTQTEKGVRAHIIDHNWSRFGTIQSKFWSKIWKFGGNKYKNKNKLSKYS